MKNEIRRNKLFCRTPIMTALLAGVFLIGKAPAQSPEPSVESRFLLIFNTSSDMKKRLPTVQSDLDTLLAANMRGELHTGDSLGVWTFDREVRAGQFPLQQWAPADAALIASNILQFVTRQHYSKTTSFVALRPYLDWIVQHSERLTVIIFYDGESTISGTPFDAAVNRIVQQQRAQRKKARQPFIIVLRSQLGRYIGCAMDQPPVVVGFPPFPALPLPPAPTNAPSPALERTNTPPVAKVPPLIVIGTRTETNLPPPEPEPAAPVITRPPPLAVAVPLTNPAARMETNSAPVAPPQPTNPPAAAPTHPVAFPVASTNAAAPPEHSGLGGRKTLATGAALLVLAGALVILLLSRFRKTRHESLITRSMNPGDKPPMQK